MNAAAGSRSEPDVQVQGYCVHCRSQRPMQGAIEVCNKRGLRDLKGQCAICGKPMYRLGGWDSLHTVVDKNTPHEPAL
jgi:hypothetical protein